MGNSRTESHKKYYRLFKLSLNIDYDASMVEYLESLPNMAGYLKALIKDDMISRGLAVDEYDTIKLPGETSTKRFLVRGAKGYDGPDKPNRGRPRKPVDPDAVEKPKRGRGRPRKNQEDND